MKNKPLFCSFFRVELNVEQQSRPQFYQLMRKVYMPRVLKVEKIRVLLEKSIRKCLNSHLLKKRINDDKTT